MLSSNRCQNLVILGLAITFFLLYLWLPLSTPTIFNSPDETANYFWAKNFAESSRLYIIEPLNLEFNDLIHPRSIVSKGGFLLPGSFLGLPLIYGFVGKIIGIWALPYLTAVLAILGALSFLKIVEKIWGKRAGLTSFFLLLIHPAIFYYTNRGLFHNIPFVSLLLLGAYFFINQPMRFWKWKYLKDGLRGDGVGERQVKSVDSLLGALFLATSLLFRTSEAVWVVPFAILFLFLGARIDRYERVFTTIIIFGLVVGAMLFLNNSLYDNPLSVGYTAGPRAESPNTEQADAEMVGLPPATISNLVAFKDAVATLLLPFGFKPQVIVYSVYNYFLRIFWWLSIPAIFGFILSLFKWRRRTLVKSQKLYLLLSFLVSVYLIFYYGSFMLQDNPTANRVTLTSSYLRYWLPIFILFLPFVYFCLDFIINKIRTTLGRKIVFFSTLIFITFFSMRLSFFDQDDGLHFVKQNLENFNNIKLAVLSLTENEAVIIVDRGDKIFFPARKVMYPLRDETTLKALPKLLKHEPVYYYGIGINHEELDNMNKNFATHGLVMKRIEIFGKEALYKITPISNYFN